QPRRRSANALPHAPLRSSSCLYVPTRRAGDSMHLMQRGRVKDRNFWLGVYNGVIITAGDAFLHSALVIAPFLALLGAPAVVIGLVPALRIGGYFLPQLLVANRLSHLPYKLPTYNVTSGVRIGSLLVMTAGAYFFGASN